MDLSDGIVLRNRDWHLSSAIKLFFLDFTPNIRIDAQETSLSGCGQLLSEWSLLTHVLASKMSHKFVRMSGFPCAFYAIVLPNSNEFLSSYFSCRVNYVSRLVSKLADLICRHCKICLEQVTSDRESGQASKVLDCIAYVIIYNAEGILNLTEYVRGLLGPHVLQVWIATALWLAREGWIGFLCESWFALSFKNITQQSVILPTHFSHAVSDNVPAGFCGSRPLHP